MALSRRNLTLKLKSYVLVVMMLSIIAGLSAQFGGGQGTADNPWLIATADHLNDIRDYLGEEHEDKYFLQTADIDLGVAPYNEGMGWEPIGVSAANSFRGTFDGDEYVILNLTIERNTNFQGLFGYIVNATIRNVGLLDVDIYSGTGQNFGALIGRMDGSSVIESCFSSGHVAAFNNVGGLVGTVWDDDCRVVDSYSTVNVARTTGGFWEIQSPVYAGFIGSMRSGTVSRCYSLGRVESTASDYTAAVIGRRQGGEINHIYWNTETANRELAVGNEPDIFPGNTTEELLDADTYAGFDFDEVWDSIENFSFPFLDWQGEPFGLNIPGPRELIGRGGDGTVRLEWIDPMVDVDPLGFNAYLDNERVNEELVTENNYLVEGLENWEFRHFFVTAVFDEGESGRSNMLRASAVDFAGGDGSEDDPYLVESAEHLNGVRFALQSYFRQTENIDLDIPPFNEDEGWEPIGDTSFPFEGGYDGSFNSIENLFIDVDPRDRTSSNLGLFGVTEGAVLRRMNVYNANITGPVATGTLIGTASGTVITETAVYAKLSGASSAGGFTGRMNNGSEISKSVMAGSVENFTANIGGLVGSQSGENLISNSYSTAHVFSEGRFVGGLVGRRSDEAVIEYSYATGWIVAESGLDDVGGIAGSDSEAEMINSYWNLETSGQEEAVGDDGEGKTTAQLVQRATFVDWDFDDVWSIDEGAVYPFLQWQHSPSFYNRPTPFNVNIDADMAEEEFRLTWDIVGEPVRYDIFRDGEEVDSVNHPTRNWVDDDIEPYTYYDYYVKAIYVIDEEDVATPPSPTVTGIIVAPFEGGDGTEENPYQVATPLQLHNVRYLLRSHFIQTADINLDVPPYNQNEGWVAIGTNQVGERFLGSYNGNGYLISNLFIDNEESYQGLFAYLDNAVLENIMLEDVDITANDFIGPLAGYQDNSKVIGCGVSGSITSTAATVSRMGGLIGQMSGGTEETNYILYSFSTADVSGANNTGGLVGDTNNGLIKSSWASGDVTGRANTGGLIGYSRTNVENCFALGNVTGSSTYTGGLIAVSTAITGNSYARGNVRGTSRTAGLVSRLSLESRVINCYSTGTVEGTAFVGALIGDNASQHPEPVINSYWDLETSNFDESAGGEGRMSRQMRYPYDDLTYVDWDFEETWTDDIDDINNSYPILYYQFERLDTPVVDIEIREIDGSEHTVLSWEAVEGANSYRIYSADVPDPDDWGEPDVTGETQFIETAGEYARFYRVIASADNP